MSETVLIEELQDIISTIHYSKKQGYITDKEYRKLLNELIPLLTKLHKEEGERQPAKPKYMPSLT